MGCMRIFLQVLEILGEPSKGSLQLSFPDSSSLNHFLLHGDLVAENLHQLLVLIGLLLLFQDGLSLYQVQFLVEVKLDMRVKQQEGCLQDRVMLGCLELAEGEHPLI